MDGIGTARGAPPVADGPGIVDDAGFEAAFREHFAAVYRFIARRVGPDLADDLAAETFATAYRRRATFRPGRATLRSWLYGIAANLLRNHWRTERRLLERDPQLAAGATSPTAPDAGSDDLAPRLAAMSCPTASHCVATGLGPAFQRTHRGLVLLSDDGGITWHPGTLPQSVRPWTSAPDCVDARHCFLTTVHIVGSQGLRILHLPAGWVYIHAVRHANVFTSISSLQCPQAGTCIALADNVAGNK